MAMIDTTYSVNWIGIWKRLAIYMAAAINGMFALFLVLRYVFSGFDYSHTFEHVTPIEVVLMMLGMCVFSAASAFILALFFIFASVTVRSGRLEGRNYWGFKRSFALDDIDSISSFSNNGLNAIVVESKHNGKVFIWEFTERMDELLGILSTFSPKENTDEGITIP